MPQSHDHRIITLLDNGRLQPKFLHCFENSVHPLADIFIWRVGKLIDEANYFWITSELLTQNVLRSNVPGQSTRALDFNSVIKDSHLNVGGNAVVPMQYCICDNLVQRLFRIAYSLKAVDTELLGSFQYRLCLFDCIIN